LNWARKCARTWGFSRRPTCAQCCVAREARHDGNETHGCLVTRVRKCQRVFNGVDMRIEATRSSMSMSPLCINKDGCSRVRAFSSEDPDPTRCRYILMYAAAHKLKEARSAVQVVGTTVTYASAVRAAGDPRSRAVARPRACLKHTAACGASTRCSTRMKLRGALQGSWCPCLSGRGVTRPGSGFQSPSVEGRAFRGCSASACVSVRWYTN
jgi:hypothetical protein